MAKTAHTPAFEDGLITKEELDTLDEAISLVGSAAYLVFLGTLDGVDASPESIFHLQVSTSEYHHLWEPIAKRIAFEREERSTDAS